MTKLEEKLLQLGYEVYINNSLVCTAIQFSKYYGNHRLYIFYNSIKEVCFGERIVPCAFYSNQSQIDNLQQAFNQLQKDLEVLRECLNVENVNI